MKHTKLIVSDIDGTLLRDGKPTEGLQTLRRVMAIHKGKVALVYATGRSFESTWNLIEGGVLPVPEAVAPFVGTEIWFPGWSAPDGDHRKGLLHNWDRNIALQVGRSIEGLSLQGDEFQSDLKLSYFTGGSRTIYHMESLLEQAGIEARVIYSCGQFVDVVPTGAGKRNAVEYLREIWSISAKNVLTCGDSGNDLDMLADPETLGVAVGNSQSEVFHLRDSTGVYLAALPFAAGVLEGAAAFRFWPDSMSPAMGRGLP